MDNFKFGDFLIILFLFGLIILILTIYDNSITQKIIDLNNNLDRVHVYNDCLQHGGSYYCLEDISNGQND